MSSFLTHHGVLIALVCAGAAVAYGILTSRALLALSPGNETMRSISAAVQEGARAYLNRQYTTIAGVGVILFIALIPIQNIRVAIGFAIGGALSAAASSPRARTLAPIWSEKSKPGSRRTTRVTPPSSPITSATTSATAPVWRPTSSRRMRSPPSP